jgi:hypothetical protein
MNIEDYIATHYVAGTKKVGIGLPIREIENLSLNIFILVLTRDHRVGLLAPGIKATHVYLVECLQPMVYDWCTSLLGNMKSQLTDYKQGRKRNFGFISILCCFFFEKVPFLSPRIKIIPHRLCDRAMSRWTEVMRWLGGGRVPTP